MKRMVILIVCGCAIVSLSFAEELQKQKRRPRIALVNMAEVFQRTQENIVINGGDSGNDDFNNNPEYAELLEEYQSVTSTINSLTQKARMNYLAESASRAETGTNGFDMAAFREAMESVEYDEVGDDGDFEIVALRQKQAALVEKLENLMAEYYTRESFTQKEMWEKIYQVIQAYSSGRYDAVINGSRRDILLYPSYESYTNITSVIIEEVAKTWSAGSR